MDEALPHRPAERGRRVAAHHRLLCVEHEGAFVAELAAHDGNKLRRRAAEQAHVLLRDRDAERLPKPVQRPVVVAVFPVAQRTGAEPLPVQHEDLCADPPGGLHIVFAFNIDGYNSSELATILNDRYGICVRGGYHCAPKKHEALDTLDTGLVRVSFSYYNTLQQVARLVMTIKHILSKGK